MYRLELICIRLFTSCSLFRYDLTLSHPTANHGVPKSVFYDAHAAVVADTSPETRQFGVSLEV